jgi:NAD+ diphosphatase
MRTRITNYHHHRAQTSTSLAASSKTNEQLGVSAMLRSWYARSLSSPRVINNPFTGLTLNRLSWLRTSHHFLNAIVQSPNTRWLLFNSGRPLVVSGSTQKQHLAYLTTQDVKPFLGEEPYFGQGEAPGILLNTVEETSHTEACRHIGSPVVFLGLRELESSTSALPSSEFKDAEEAVKNLEGTPYFSMEVEDLNLNEKQLEVILNNTESARSGQILSWSETRILFATLDPFDVSIFAEAKSMVDWNQRNKVCGLLFSL